MRPHTPLTLPAPDAPPGATAHHRALADLLRAAVALEADPGDWAGPLATPPAESEEGQPTVPEMPAVQVPESSPDEVVEAPDFIRDEWTGPVTNVVGRKDSWVPVSIGVEFFAAGKVRQGTVRFIGMDGLYLMSSRVPGDIEGKVIVTCPVPLEGRTKAVYLVCGVSRIDRIAERGFSGIELEILSVRKEPVPGLFRRYVKYLCFRMIADDR